MFAVIVTVLALIILAVAVHFALIGRKEHARAIAQTRLLSSSPYGHATRRGRHVKRSARRARARRILAAHAA